MFFVFKTVIRLILRKFHGSRGLRFADWQEEATSGARHAPAIPCLQLVSLESRIRGADEGWSLEVVDHEERRPFGMRPFLRIRMRTVNSIAPSKLKKFGHSSRALPRVLGTDWQFLRHVCGEVRAV